MHLESAKHVARAGMEFVKEIFPPIAARQFLAHGIDYINLVRDRRDIIIEVIQAVMALLHDFVNRGGVPERVRIRDVRVDLVTPVTMGTSLVQQGDRRRHRLRHMRTEYAWPGKGCHGTCILTGRL